MIKTKALVIYYLVSIFAAAVILHELGHYFYFKAFLKKNIKFNMYYKKNILDFRIEAGDPGDYENLKDLEYYNVNLFGVVLGTLPILIGSLTLSLTIVLMIPYLIGCIPDIKEMVKVVKCNKTI